MNAIEKAHSLPVREMSPLQLTVRCFAEREDNQWQAFSLEFGLAAQGDSLGEVRHKLVSMILSYLHDALVGDDRDHAYELLSRKAHWSVYLKYYFYMPVSIVGKLFFNSKERMFYREPLALEPKACSA